MAFVHFRCPCKHSASTTNVQPLIELDVCALIQSEYASTARNFAYPLAPILFYTHHSHPPLPVCCHDALFRPPDPCVTPCVSPWHAQFLCMSELVLSFVLPYYYSQPLYARFFFHPPGFVPHHFMLSLGVTPLIACSLFPEHGMLLKNLTGPPPLLIYGFFSSTTLPFTYLPSTLLGLIPWSWSFP